MRLSITLAASVIAVALSLGLSAPAGARQGGDVPAAVASAEKGRGGCQTRACFIRVRVHRVYGFCNTWACVRRVNRIRARRAERMMRRYIAPHLAWLARVRACESPDGRSDPSGTYHGYYQFDMSSWAGAGGSGHPGAASWLEQSYRAVRWLRIAGRGAWPRCG